MLNNELNVILSLYEVIELKNKKIVFMGTASFSAKVLEMLIDNQYNVELVVTQPDRRVGRKKEIKMPEVKEIALEKSIPVFQPNNIKDDFQCIKELQPDLIVTAAYGQILPKQLLEIPSIGCINVHASLLPKYRGGAPVHQAIIDGQQETGVTIMYMVEKMDAGNMISQCKTPIYQDDTVGTLYDRLSILGAKLLEETLPSILNRTNQSIQQDEEEVTYAPTISRKQEHVDFSNTAFLVDCKIRGLNPWPGAFVTYKGKTVKIWEGKIHQCQNAVKHHAHQECGTIVKIFKDAIGVKVKDGVYLITELQMEGKKRMNASDLLNGNHMFEVDTRFE